MIIYAADRAMNILGMASTDLRDGLTAYEDTKTEDVETGVAGFEFSVHYTTENRKKAESMFEIGNYILRKDGKDEGFFTITDYNSDSKDQSITAYAEDAGLDLLNDVCVPYSADEVYNIAHYVQMAIDGSGFEIGKNEYGTAKKRFAFANEQTAKERLDDIAEAFGAEISYGFEIKGLTVLHKYVHIHKKRGIDNGIRLTLNREIDSIRVSKNINELATGLIVVGGTGNNSDIPINLDGYSYDDGDFYVSGKNLYSREALKKWARFMPNVMRQAAGVSAHILRTFRSDTVSQAQLCQEAIAQLKIYREAQINYEIDISRFPESVSLGDTVYIIDEAGELYLQSRILKLETRVSEHKKIATLGEFLIREGGVSETVRQMAAEFAELVKTRKLYTWIVYADGDDGTGISTDPDGKTYMGVSPNHFQETPDLTDPTVYTWSKIQGVDAITMVIITDNGNIFKNSSGSTTLTAHVYKAGAELSAAAIAAIGTIKWYKDGGSTAVGTGVTLTVNAGSVTNKATYEARLESA